MDWDRKGRLANQIFFRFLIFKFRIMGVYSEKLGFIAQINYYLSKGGDFIQVFGTGTGKSALKAIQRR